MSWAVQFPDDEHGDGPQNVCLLSIQPRDVAAGPIISYLMRYTCVFGAWGGVVVKTLRHYSDGLGIDSR